MTSPSDAAPSTGPLFVVLVTLAAGTACGGSASKRITPPSPAPTTMAPSDVPPGTSPGGEEVPALDAIAARGPTDAPLMREILRTDRALERPTVPVTTDACFRAAVASSSPVRAWFEDESRSLRGAATARMTRGLVPPNGPACARKGEKIRLVVETANATTLARAVVWQAP